MRYISFLGILLLFFSCNGNSSQPESPATGQAKPVSTRTDSGPAKPIISVDADGPADIQVEVTGVPDGPTFLIGHVEDRQFRADSSYLQNGKVRFQKADGYDQGYYFVYLPNRMPLQILVPEDQKFQIKTNMNNLIMMAEVSGSTDNELLYRNLQFQERQTPLFQRVARDMQGLAPNSAAYQELKAEQDALVAERKAHLEELYAEQPNSLFTAFKRAGQNPDLRDIKNPDGTPDEAAQLMYYRLDFWDGVDFSDERLLRTPVIANKLKRYLQEITPQHQDSIIKYADILIDKVEGKYPAYFKFFANWVPLQYQPTKSTLMDAEAVMVHMVQNYFTEEKAFWSNPAELQGLQQRAMEMQASLVGKKGPNVTSTDPSGKSRSIYDMKQDYIIVLLFNPECEHCIEETPQLLSLYNRLKRDLGIYAIAIDTDDTKWRNFIQNFGIQEWTNVFDPTNRSIYAKYFVDKTPEIYVLNPERTIIGKNLKVFQIEEVIRRDRERRGL